MTQSFYKNHTESFFIGLRVRTLESMNNSVVYIPAGRIATITRKSGGFSLKFDACPTCKMQPYITGVEPEFVKLFGE